MKETHRCPKCERQGRPGTNVAHLPTVDDSARIAYVPQALTHKVSFFGAESHGLVEAYVCNDCGYLEYYITDYPLPPAESKQK